MAYKTGLLETIIFRCVSICSSYEKFHKEIVKFKEIFKRNSYPEKFIDRRIKRFLNKRHVPKVIELTAAKKKLILVMPYLSGQQLFEIRNRIQCCLKKNKVRACKHLGITPLTEKRVRSPKESAVFDHIVHTGHNASFDDFEILVKECDEFRLLLRESF